MGFNYGQNAENALRHCRATISGHRSWTIGIVLRAPGFALFGLSDLMKLGLALFDLGCSTINPHQLAAYH